MNLPGKNDTSNKREKADDRVRATGPVGAGSDGAGSGQNDPSHQGVGHVGITLRAIEKSFNGQPVLRDVNLEIEPGEFVCVLGASGCGKSTLLRVVAGLESPDPVSRLEQRTNGSDSRPRSDSVEKSHGESQRISTSLANGGPPGLQWRTPHRKEPRMGFVFQQANLLPWRRVKENITLPLELQGVRREDRREAVEKALAEVGLTREDGRKWPRMLSGGMQMRASLARALVTAPQLMLLDEPFSALDEILRQRLGEELRGWHQQFKWTTLFVTHHVAEAVFLADRILVFRNLARHPDQPSIAADLRIKFSGPRVPELRETREFTEKTIEVTRWFRGVES